MNRHADRMPRCFLARMRRRPRARRCAWLGGVRRRWWRRRPSNLAPIGVFTATPTSGAAPLAVAFDAAARPIPTAASRATAGSSATAAPARAPRSATPTDGRHVHRHADRHRQPRAQLPARSQSCTVTAGPPPQRDRQRPHHLRARAVPAAPRELASTITAPSRRRRARSRSNCCRLRAARCSPRPHDGCERPLLAAGTLNTDVFVRAKALSRVGSHSAAGGWDLRVLEQHQRQRALRARRRGVQHGRGRPDAQPDRARPAGAADFAGVYTGVRAAAPFAVLDTLYSAAQFVITQGDLGLQLPPLDAYWSPRTTRPPPGTPASATSARRSYAGGHATAPTRASTCSAHAEQRHRRVRPARHRARVPAFPRGCVQSRRHALAARTR